jgi:hypothetical protein
MLGSIVTIPVRQYSEKTGLTELVKIPVTQHGQNTGYTT